MIMCRGDCRSFKRKRNSIEHFEPSLTERVFYLKRERDQKKERKKE